MMKTIKKITLDRETLKEFVGGFSSLGEQADATFSGGCQDGVCTYGCPGTWGTCTCGGSPCDDCW